MNHRVLLDDITGCQITYEPQPAGQVRVVFGFRYRAPGIMVAWSLLKPIAREAWHNILKAKVSDTL